MDNRKTFLLDSKSVKIKEILNQDFLQIEIYAISEGENRNKTSFPLSALEEAIPTFYNKFILGYFNTKTNPDGNFEEHNADIKYDHDTQESYWSYINPSSEKALGMIRESDKVEITDYKGKKWIKLTAVILIKYNREAVKHLLKIKKRKVSVEISVERSHFEGDIEVIDSFILDGITILGNYENTNIPAEEGIEGAHLKLLDFLNTELFSHQRLALQYAYKEFNDNDNDNDDDDIEEQEVDNENKPEIEFEDNKKEPKEEKKQMTYEQKMQLLSSCLYEALKNRNSEDEEYYCWIMDFSDEYVIYNDKGTFLKTPYSLEDNTCSFNFDEAVPVMREWIEVEKIKIIVDEEEDFSFSAILNKYTILTEENAQKQVEIEDLQVTISEMVTKEVYTALEKENEELKTSVLEMMPKANYEKLEVDFEALRLEKEQLTEKYVSLEESFETANIKIHDYEKSIIFKNAESLIDIECLSDDEQEDVLMKQNIKDFILSQINENVCKTQEETNSLVEVELAKAFYKKNKKDKKTNFQKAFTAPIITPPPGKKEESVYESLNKHMDNLNKI